MRRPHAESPCDIVLVFTQNIGQGSGQSCTHNLGGGYVLAYLRQHGISGLYFAPPGHLSVAEAAARILELRPRVVGFTVYATNFDCSKLIAEALKRLSPDTVIVFGGPTPSTMDEDVLRLAPAVDVCVRGAGEETMLQLMAALSQPHWRDDCSSLQDIKGLAFRRGSEHVRSLDSEALLGSPRLHDSLDRYPSPHLEGIIPPEAAVGWHGTGIITARGCNQSCTYCNCAILSNRHIFTHSIDRVLSEIEYIAKSQPDDRPLVIQDDGFTLIPSRARSVCEGLIQRGIRARMSCITRCDLVDAETLDLMHAAGFVSIGFALESATPRVLRVIGKTSPPEDHPGDALERENRFIERLKWAVSYCREKGFQSVFASIMVGLPTETPEEARETIRVVNNLKLDYYMHNLLTVYPGTPIYAQHRKYGYKVECSPGDVHTVHPFDASSQVPLGDKADKLASARRNNRIVASSLSLSLHGYGTSRAFEGVIFDKDELSRADVAWLEEVLVVDGLVVQTYSSHAAVRAFRARNHQVIKEVARPTKRWFDYSTDNTASGRVLRFVRDFCTSGDLEGALSVAFVPARQMGREPGEHSVFDRSSMICFDETEDDVYACRGLLSSLGTAERSTSSAFLEKGMPRFGSLCRWTRQAGNCRTLGVAIVDASQGVRFCWCDSPVGKVGDRLSSLRRKHERRLAKVRELRGCSRCPANETCIKCSATHPLTERAYCRMQTQEPVYREAEVLATLSILNDAAF